MALKHVTQDNYNGCFIAALAMLIGKTYNQAYKLLFPKRDPLTGDHALPSEERDNHDIGMAAVRALKKCGYKAKRSTYKQIKSLCRYARKNVLLILRWGGGSMCHAVVFDAETKQFLDPNGETFDAKEFKFYQRSLDSMYYVERAA